MQTSSHTTDIISFMIIVFGLEGLLVQLSSPTTILQKQVFRIAG